MQSRYTPPDQGESRVTTGAPRGRAIASGTDCVAARWCSGALRYAAGAWGLLQVLQFLADTYDWPAQVLRLVTLAFAIGLPIALTLAWYHGDRGHQKPVRAEIAIVALLLVLGGGALWFYSHRGAPAPTVTPSSTAAPGPAATTAPADARPSIAVLPFENRSDEAKGCFLRRRRP